jgi:hypothetical protein
MRRRRRGGGASRWGLVGGGGGNVSSSWAPSSDFISGSYTLFILRKKIFLFCVLFQVISTFNFSKVAEDSMEENINFLCFIF